MVYVPTINHPGSTMQRGGIAVLGALFALALLAVGFGLYSPVAEAIRANAAGARIQSLVNNQLGDAQLTPARHLAQQQLEEAGPVAVDPLIAALHSPDSILRRNSAEMLGYIASPLALDALSTAMANDLVPSVRARAAWSLGELSDIRIAAPLERTAVIDPSPQVRQEAEYSLTALRARLAVAAGKSDSLAGAFAIAPSAQNMVYLAERNRLSISRDGGRTWSATTGSTPTGIYALAVSPANPDVIYAGTDSLGLYKSTDGGTTWVSMNQGMGVDPGVRLCVTALAIDPQNPERIYAARGVYLGTAHVSLLPVGVMLSTDGGASWQKVDAPTTETAITRLVISGNKLYASAGGRIVIVNPKLYARSGDRLVLLRLQNGAHVSTLYDNSEVSADGPTCAGSNCR